MAEAEVILLRRFAESADAEAFSEITRRYAGMVYASCRRVLNNEAKAADATQETFYHLVKNSGEITGSLAGWLHRVATRKSIDMIRKDTSRSNIEKSYADTAQKEINEWQELSPHVDQAMDQLDDNTKEMIVRHFLGGKSMRQVAEEVGVSQPTVSRKIEKGVSQLRGILQKKGLIVSLTALGGMLLTNTVEAAPAVVINELGKMAIAGTAAAGAGAAAGTTATAATVTTTTTTAAGVKAAGATITAGIKAKVAVAIVAASVGTGTVVTYNQVNKPTMPEPVVHTTVVETVKTVQPVISTPAPTQNNLAAEKQWDEFLDELAREEAAAKSEFAEADVQPSDPPEIANKQIDNPRGLGVADGVAAPTAERMGGSKGENQTKPRTSKSPQGGMMGGSESK